MAGIDKIYVSSYEDYKLFKDWTEKQFVVFFDNYKRCVGDYIFDWWEEEDFVKEIPIINSPTWIDVYLIQNCLFKFIQDRLKDMYSEKSYNELKNTKFPVSLPKTYKQNRKIIIRPAVDCKFPFRKKMFNRPIGGKTWWLQCEDGFWYNSKTKRWVSEGLLYPVNTNTSHHKTTKSLIRFLRKQYLPSGITFNLSGNYSGEEYIIIIK